MFFVTFHQTVANVNAYDDDGNLTAANVLNPSGQTLAELRGLYLNSAQDCSTWPTGPRRRAMSSASRARERATPS